MGVQGLGEPEIIQGGWPQVAHDPAHVRDGGLGLVARPIQQLLDVAAGAVAGGLDREARSRPRRIRVRHGDRAECGDALPRAR